MSIAELYVNLGIKGADKTVGALGSIKKGLGEVSSMSLEAKAAILAAVYGLERMMSASATAGTSLSNLGASYGFNTKQLQQWGYALSLAGGSMDEMDGIATKISKTMTGITKFGQAVPAGLQILMNNAGVANWAQYANDPFKMQELFIKGMKNIGNSTELKQASSWLLDSLGLGAHWNAAAQKGLFSAETFNKAPIRSDKMIGQLDKVNQSMVNTKLQMEKLFDNFTAAHGQQLAKDILSIATALAQLADAADKLATSSKLFWIIEKLVQLSSFTMSATAKDINYGKYLVTDTVHNIVKTLKHPALGPNSQATIEQTVNSNVHVYGADPKDHHHIKTMHERAAKQSHHQAVSQMPKAGQ